MAQPLCTNCFHCKKLSDEGADCEQAKKTVRPVYRHEVEEGRYENCPWRNLSATVIELRMINLVCRIYENWDEATGQRHARPKRLNSLELAEIEAQVRKCGTAEDYLPMNTKQAA